MHLLYYLLLCITLLHLHFSMSRNSRFVIWPDFDFCFILTNVFLSITKRLNFTFPCNKI